MVCGLQQLGSMVGDVRHVKVKGLGTFPIFQSTRHMECIDALAEIYSDSPTSLAVSGRHTVLGVVGGSKIV